MEINMYNFKQELFHFFEENYEDRTGPIYEELVEEFPYDNSGFSDEFCLKNFIDWLMIEKPLPDSGKTVVEEFVEAHPELPDDIKSNYLHMKNIIRSKFKFINRENNPALLKDTLTNKTYKIYLWEELSKIPSDTIMEGRIHPFGENYYFAGIVRHKVSNPFITEADFEGLLGGMEIGMINDVEKKTIYSNSTLMNILNKYPVEWINGICKSLSIKPMAKKEERIKQIKNKIDGSFHEILEKLPEKSKEILKCIIEKGGFVRYNLLNDFEDDISYWWTKNLPESEIGILRSKGLLTVGKMPLNGKMYKVALIPTDIRENIKKYFESITGGIQKKLV
ncbi:MAG: hypothetical protein Q8N99_07625 [Nanoarchaeota archaeon]|nr:hypothetical protein [Nanoarchaeota archaeon]